jgi:hypothetical protein
MMMRASEPPNSLGLAEIGGSFSDPKRIISMIQKGSREFLLHASQLRAARGLLGWSQTDLAREAGLSLPTVKRVESDIGVVVSLEARSRLRRALEVAGVEFIDANGGGPGVRLRNP